MTDQPKRSDRTQAVDEQRKARLAAALRANLRRRKAQSRGRAAEEESTSGDDDKST